MRNHEGYKDITAGKAIRNVIKKRKKSYSKHLTYILGEVPGFPKKKK